MVWCFGALVFRRLKVVKGARWFVDRWFGSKAGSEVKVLRWFGGSVA